jgi:hypothetical protein
VTLEELKTEGLLYIAIITGGFGIDSFKEGDKIWGLILMLVTAGLVVLRLWLKKKGFVKMMAASDHL